QWGYHSVSLSVKKHDQETNEWNQIGETKNLNILKDVDSKYFIDFKLLKNEDLIIFTANGIYIWTANSEEKISLLYYWRNHKISESSKSTHEAIIRLLDFLRDEFESSR
ncbi:10847_t:CDS:1, partial [Scutellospora calospora]